jgi:hypothetical protein
MAEKRRGIRTGAWSTSGRLVVGGNLAVRLQASFYDEADDRQRPAGVYTVQFGVLAQAGMYKKVNPVARVIWSAEGNSITRKLSVVDGSSISGIADHVAVSVTDETTIIDEGGGGAEYSVTILAAPFPRPSRGVPSYLSGHPFPIEVTSSPFDLLVPDDAGVTSALVSVVLFGGGISRVTEIAASDTPLAQYVPGPMWMPLHPQTSALRLENLGPSGSSVNYSVLWGIDG